MGWYGCSFHGTGNADAHACAAWSNRTFTNRTVFRGRELTKLHGVVSLTQRLRITWLFFAWKVPCRDEFIVGVACNVQIVRTHMVAYEIIVHGRGGMYDWSWENTKIPQARWGAAFPEEIPGHVSLEGVLGRWEGCQLR